ncbi:hypothetical protein R1flu_004444 [Riccia fluitans]|uniref:Uncharacterized protein n=1 Tax=Riccia fluitans TaxID=41844 RepID=A0ABD1YR39_9MARC
MSRTLPDLHHRRRDHPEGRRAEQRRDSPLASGVNVSGEILVGQGEDSRLIFKSAKNTGSTNFFSEDSSKYQRTKDLVDIPNYVQLRWQFCHKFLQSQQSKDLITALNRIVSILKFLDLDLSQQHPVGNGYPNNGSGSAPDFRRDFNQGFAPEHAEVDPDRLNINFTSAGREDFVNENNRVLINENDRDFGSPARSSRHFGEKRKLPSENEDRPDPSVDYYEREEIRAPVKRMRERNETVHQVEPNSHHDDSRNYQTGEEEYIIDSDVEIKGSYSPPSNKTGKCGGPQAWRGRKPGRENDRTNNRKQAKGKEKMKSPIRSKKSKVDEAETLIVPEVDKAFEPSQWESMDARARVTTILTQFFNLEQYFRVKYEKGESRAGEDGGRRKNRPDLSAGDYLRAKNYCLNQSSCIIGEIEVRVTRYMAYEEMGKKVYVYDGLQERVRYGGVQKTIAVILLAVENLLVLLDRQDVEVDVFWVNSRGAVVAPKLQLLKVAQDKRSCFAVWFI